MSEDRYCIEYTITDYPMGSSPAYPFSQAGYNLTKEEADIEVKRLNDKDDLRVENIRSCGKQTNIYYNYFSKKVN